MDVKERAFGILAAKQPERLAAVTMRQSIKKPVQIPLLMVIAELTPLPAVMPIPSALTITAPARQPALALHSAPEV